jgi:hypothetical protein
MLLQVHLSETELLTPTMVQVMVHIAQVLHLVQVMQEV